MAALEVSLFSFVAHIANIPEATTAEEFDNEISRYCQDASAQAGAESHESPDDVIAPEKRGASESGAGTVCASSSPLPVDLASSLLEAKLVIDQSTGASRGFAFATFSSEMERNAFIRSTNGSFLCGARPVEEGGAGGLIVSEAKPKKKAPKKEKKEKNGVDLGKGGRQWLAKAKRHNSNPKHKATMSTDTNRRYSKCN